MTRGVLGAVPGEHRVRHTDEPFFSTTAGRRGLFLPSLSFPMARLYSSRFRGAFALGFAALGARPGAPA